MSIPENLYPIRITMDNYSFGQCGICHKDKALKDGVCQECKEKCDMPDFMKEILFNMGKNND